VIRLLASEWMRFRSRRLVRILALLAAIGILLVVVVAAVTTHPPDELRLSDLPEVLHGVAFVTILIGLVIGASSVGASWQTGTITTILTWETRRIRVALSRGLVVGVGVFVLALALLSFLSLVVTIAAGVRGSTTTPPGWLGEVVGIGVRVSIVAACASLIGGAVATIGRNTAAALGGVFVYLAVLEGVLRGFRPASARYLLGDNIVTFVVGDPMNPYRDIVLTPGRAGVVIGAYVALLVVAGLVMFRVRDVQ
jgi:ABC-type transport system involved in multi-copper enzyme maturation permease subunit